MFLVTTAYLGLYLQFEPSKISPWLFYVTYLGNFEFVLHQRIFVKNWKRMRYLIWGISLVATNVAILEGIGHGYFEHHHSYVGEFFNSVFHTPLYGINSVLISLGLEQRGDHTCW